ncbi:formate dehydrogenase subunit beta, partial [Escherichia coli]
MGFYDTPADLSAKSWTVMRFSETEQNGKLEWLIRKAGWSHGENPGCRRPAPSLGEIIKAAKGLGVSRGKTHLVGVSLLRGAGFIFPAPKKSKPGCKITP